MNLRSSIAFGLLPALIVLAACSTGCEQNLAEDQTVVFTTAVSNSASTGAGHIRLPEGFHAELVYKPTLGKEGSWVAMTVDPQGRLIAADQFGKLYRVNPSPLGAPQSDTKVEPLDLALGSAQGLLCVENSLYVMVNSAKGKFTSGLYRATDTNNDDQYNKIEELRTFKGAGEHGPHAVVLGPDGKSLYFCAGNATGVPFYSNTMVSPNWQEDQFLPRIQDRGGSGAPAPGGWIARTDLDGLKLEIVSVGYRNEYDIAFNPQGDLFTVDADMEWDIGSPWYRPTRVCHVLSGSDFGWRGHNGKWASEWPDTLAPVTELGPGSPSGIAMGTGTNYPPEYQQMLFVGDWGCGTINAVKLLPEGATYRGDVQSFASAMPLAVTDMVVRPQDGCLYFAVGGRKIQSAVYRIVYDGKTATQAAGVDDSSTEARAFRRKIEQLHGSRKDEDLADVWKGLASPDRAVRHAARVALEFQPLENWLTKAVVLPDPQARLTAMLAAVRIGTVEDFPQIWDALSGFEFEQLSVEHRVALLRTTHLAIVRLRRPTMEVQREMVTYFDPHFPTSEPQVDQLLAQLLAGLQPPELAPRLVEAIKSSPATTDAFGYAVSAAFLQSGWDAQTAGEVLRWFVDAAAQGGRTPLGYLTKTRQLFLGNLPAEVREELADLAEQPLKSKSPQQHAKSGKVVKQWRSSHVLEALAADRKALDGELQLTPEQRKRGRAAFAGASCYQCHRLDGLGATMGPDLSTVGRRFSVEDLVTAIVEPDEQISDRFQQTMFVVNGKTVVGRMISRKDNEIVVITNPLDPAGMMTLQLGQIDELLPSETSMMPSGLLDTLTEQQVRDLIYYLRAQR